MYVRMYVCMYVCMYACMYVWMHACMLGCMYICMYVYMYVWIYVCMYVFMHVCMYVCLYVCMYVCNYVCMLRNCTKTTGRRATELRMHSKHLSGKLLRCAELLDLLEVPVFVMPYVQRDRSSKTTIQSVAMSSKRESWNGRVSLRTNSQKRFVMKTSGRMRSDGLRLKLWHVLPSRAEYTECLCTRMDE